MGSESSPLVGSRESTPRGRGWRHLALLSIFGLAVMVSRVRSRGATTTEFEARDDDVGYSYGVGTPAPSFSLELVDNTTLTYSALDHSSGLPMIVVGVDPADPWIRWMFSDKDSLRGFSAAVPSETQVVFAGLDDAGVEFVVEGLATDLANVSSAAFSKDTVPRTLETLLEESAWRSYVYGWEIGEMRGWRLDCFFLWCSSVDGEVTVVDGGDACGPEFNATRFVDGDVALVSRASCASATEAALRVFFGTAASGVLVAAMPGEMLEPIGSYDSSFYDDYAGMISAEDAALVASTMDASGRTRLNFTTNDVRGYFVGIDSNGMLYDLGYRFVQDARFVAWEALYLAYLSKVDAADERSAYVVPVFDHAVLNDMTKKSTIQLPPSDMMRRFESMVFDVYLACDGATDSTCPKWDHVITVYADCDQQGRRRLEVGGEANELLRIVTPYRRNVGHWRADRTPLMPMLFGTECNATAEVTSGTGWTLTLDVRFEGTFGPKLLAPAAVTELVFPGYNPDASTHELKFDSIASYDANKTIVFDVPAVGGGVRKVELVATISGHGDCEFEPTAHTYAINNHSFEIEMFGAGTMWGCAEQIKKGVEPNTHGTFTYGRDGWCNGSPVKMHTFDVTAAVDFDAPNTLVYSATSYGDDDARWEASIHHVYLAPTKRTDGCGGYMLVTSYLVFYAAAA
ncbi:hypothetical protein CTAYLR_008136 [Chrysophaeum taylorii]|uniref:Peptide-N-glycosidase F N-terminal domain-containing protein n=1 Tax=Chrysophaeum taylorii TaxID=2483200 RepID=A0AAD7XQ31_9STRA|nr:hypothetical protein CTAYLR_008136 [Chrysophaeum taylorii]